jgi:hypothetical protein
MTSCCEGASLSRLPMCLDFVFIASSVAACPLNMRQVLYLPDRNPDQQCHRRCCACPKRALAMQVVLLTGPRTPRWRAFAVHVAKSRDLRFPRPLLMHTMKSWPSPPPGGLQTRIVCYLFLQTQGCLNDVAIWRADVHIVPAPIQNPLSCCCCCCCSCCCCCRT